MAHESDPNRIGATIGVQDSALLAELDATGLTLGTIAYVTALASEFTLTLSTASLVTDQVVAVNGIDGYRWIRGGGGGVDVIPPNQIFVARDGNDANSGLNGFPKKTASAGYLALMALGGGTLTVEHLSWASPVSGAGLWVSGTFDVGTAPSPWVKADPAFPWELEMIPGVSAQDDFAQGQLAPGGGASTFNGPVLQVAGYLSGFVCSNLLAYVSPSIDAVTYFPACRVGLSSPLAAWSAGTTYAANLSVEASDGKSYTSLVDSNTGNDPTTSPSFWIRCRRDVGDAGGNAIAQSLTANIIWDNCTFQNALVGTGPAYDAGFTFLVWHQSVVWIHTGLGSSPLDAATNCAARCITGGVLSLPATSYLQFMDSRCRAVGSGWYMEGGNNEVQYNVDAMFGENMTTATVTLAPGFGGAASGIFANVQNGDSVDGVSVRNLGGALITTTNCPNVVGPSVDLATSVAGQGAHNPLAFGQVGMSGPSLKMQVDNARRMFGPHTGRYPNIAAPATATWQPTSSPITGPSGLANSGLLLGAQTYLFLPGYSFFGSLAAGDCLAFGAWVQFTGTPSSSGFIVENVGSGDLEIELFSPGNGLPIAQTLNSASPNANWLGGQPLATGQWLWIWAYLKIVSIPDGAVLAITVANAVGADDTWVIQVPAADGVPIEEVGEMALAGESTPNAGGVPNASGALAPTTGMPAMKPGSKLAFWDSTLGAWKYLDIDNGAVRIT